MATLPTTKRISLEDIKGAPKWFMGALSQINTFFDAFYNAVNGQLTFVDNISAQVRSINFETGSDYSGGTFSPLRFPLTLKRKAQGLLPLQITQSEDIYTSIKNGVSLDWYELDGYIQINFVSGLEDSTTYNMKVMVI